MTEIERLKKRLGNVQRNVIEYRMTVTEAKNLLKEIEDIQRAQTEKPQQVVDNEPVVRATRTIDGGAF